MRDKAFTADTLDKIKKSVENLQIVELDTDSHTPHLANEQHIAELMAQFWLAENVE